MKTAREQLYDEATALLQRTPDDGAVAEMRKVMARYRVQTKPGVNIPDGTTARDALGDRLLEFWRTGGDTEETKTQIGACIDEFRMQLKQAGGGDKPARPKPARPEPKKVAVAAPPPPATPPRPAPPRPSVALGVGDPPPTARPSRPSVEPVAGGPRTRKKARGECPKCHSHGVVLARSYSGDEYYSCIYCGWQAFKPADEDDPNTSLALRLLGQTLGSD